MVLMDWVKPIETNLSIYPLAHHQKSMYTYFTLESET